MRTKIKNFLRELNTEIDVLNYVDIDNIDPVNPFESICEMIEGNGGFDIEIVYYSNAIDFLAKNDPSLTESLEIAAGYGYKVKNLNSEILASLLASELIREEFYKLKSKINDFFAELNKERELKEKLENFSLEEIAAAYEKFNPEFFNGYYDIPTTRDGWMEQILEDINGNGCSFEDIFGEQK